MLLVISPSKTQNFHPSDLKNCTLPVFLDYSCRLAEYLRKLDVGQIATLMKTSKKLSESTWQSFHAFSTPFTIENAKQAILAFQGDVYSAIRTEMYQEEEFLHAQKHLRILSGFYGLLKPLDLIQPYRLEMGTALQTAKGNNLYSFWRQALTDETNQAMASFSEPLLVNLASAEYFKALQPEKLAGPVVKVSFKEKKNGAYRTIAIHAKRARGKMVDFVITNHIATLEELRTFSEDDYRLNHDLSTTSEMVFCRG